MDRATRASPARVGNSASRGRRGPSPHCPVQTRGQGRQQPSAARTSDWRVADQQARSYVGTMLGLTAKDVGDTQIDEAINAALIDGVVTEAQRHRVARLTGGAKAMAAKHMLESASETQRNHLATESTQRATSASILSGRAERRLLQRLQVDTEERAEYRELLSAQVGALDAGRRKYLDARGQEELLERMEARTAARRAETDLYRARPELVDPELRFTPKINKPYRAPHHHTSKLDQSSSAGRSPSPQLFPSRSLSQRSGSRNSKRRDMSSPERDTGRRDAN